MDDAADKPSIEIRHRADGTLDEIVAAHTHLERMDAGHWWLFVEDGKGNHVTVHLQSGCDITATVERTSAK